MTSSRIALPGSSIRVGKVPFVATDLEGATEYIVKVASESVPVSVRLSNAYCVALASKDERYAALLSQGGVNFPDGAPVVWFMRGRGRNRGLAPGRVRGPSLFRTATRATAAEGLGNFYFGTTSETLDRLTGQLRREEPGLVVSGQYAPPFGPIDEEFYERAVQAISATDASIVWVALGTPKQDFVSTEIAIRTGLPCVGVGAAFDFVAGTVAEAPQWMQSRGLEWVYRFYKEPRRLWRRYVFGNIRFLYSAFTESSNR
jgi:N-acetylglucosaminyldiphosphoundecaprenol N-acetyl-beta-D-mannosaminyltransferase